MLARALLVSLAFLLASIGSRGSAQTVRDIANRGTCSTAGIEGLSRQLAEAQMCLRPGAFVRFAPHPNITLSSSRVHPYAQATARDALHRAAQRGPLQVNSAFRTLADQYVLYHSGGCGLAARPGQSNHQSGRAVDLQNHSAARSRMEGQGCAWFGSRDPVHFDCPGGDRRSDSILAFQRLWNTNHPGDRIAEDGVYGPATESRLGRSPAGGFSRGACDAAPPPPPPPSGTTRFIGAVYEGSDAAARIGGASVRIVETGAMLTARADGIWEATVPSGTYTVEASASGFVTARRTCEVSGAETWCSIGLVRGATSGTARGQIYEDHGAPETSPPIVGAQLVIAETGDMLATDDAGAWTTSLPPGTYMLTASAEGFAAASRSCTVRAGETSDCSIGLAAEALAGVIDGVVFEGSDTSLRVIGATVRVLETGASFTSREGDGSFRFDVGAGTYTLEVSGAGLLTATRECDVAAGETTWCSVSVTRDGTDGGLPTVPVDGDEVDHSDDRDEDPRDAVDGRPGTSSATLRGGCAAGGAGDAGWALLGLALLLDRRRRD
ncbi:MAG: carboxypeptidase regulatory-like domain-containing protein [Myxococcales bacterium]|nr:carboxypeptidase regulatory-like domain-containing protein [Myxococcales bacterium]